MQNKLET